ncbi:platelet-activating factor acetylhydrolase IB subunit [soil metagenome]
MILSLLLAHTLLSTADCPPIFEPNETILFQGDSITDGNRGRSEDPNHILGHGYVFSIASRYGAAYPAQRLTFINRGVSGNKVSDLVARWQTDTIDLKPDVLSVLVGVNDIYFAKENFAGFSTEKLFETYDKLLADTKKSRPNIKFVLCQPFTLDVGMVLSDADGWHKAIAKVDVVVDQLAVKYHAPVVHFQQVFDEATKRAPADHWIWDGIHPTYSGHALMADEWIRTYNDFYRSPLLDPERNSAIKPVVNFERDTYDWLHRHADVLDLNAEGNPDVVMIGDSITNYWGGSPKAPVVSGQAEWDETFRGLKVNNLGFGWDRTQNVLWRLANAELSGISPKLIILNIGTNNLVGDSTARENSPEETAIGIETIVTNLHQCCPTSKIVVMAIFPRGFDKGNDLDARIQTVNARTSKALSTFPYVHFLDIRDRLLDRAGNLIAERFSDGTHPTDKGYAIWGAALRDSGVLPR